jgi:hypothetical protein
MSQDMNNIKNKEQVFTHLGSELYYETAACKYFICNNNIKNICKTNCYMLKYHTGILNSEIPLLEEVVLAQSSWITGYQITKHWIIGILLYLYICTFCPHHWL